MIEEALSLLLLLLIATVICDGVHALLHLGAHSRVRAFRFFASLHQTHHDFLDRSLRFHDHKLKKNLALHQLPELVMRSTVITVLGLLAGVDVSLIAAGIALCVLDLLVVVLFRGRDLFHQPHAVKAPASSIIVDGSYHALHHAFPDHFWSAHVQLLDRLFGRLLPLEGRAVVVVGSSAFCKDLVLALAQERALVIAKGGEDADDACLATADIVVLGQGASTRGSSSYEAWMARAQRAHAGKLLPLELWTVGDDPAWGARAPLLVDERTVWRRLRRAPTLGAATTLALLKRGRRSV